MTPPPPRSTLFPYTTLFRSEKDPALKFTTGKPGEQRHLNICLGKNVQAGRLLLGFTFSEPGRSEEHTSELQSHVNLVCRLLLEKKKKTIHRHTPRPSSSRFP